MKTKIIVLVALIAVLQVNSAVRFVSKTGSSTEPYTSWVTASDSIQKVVNICNYGDTIYVASGIYKEQIVFGNGISLIGSGMDSCIIDTREFATSTGWNAVIIKGNGTISGFYIRVTPYSQTGTAVFALGSKSHCNILNNKIDNCYEGINYNWNSGIIRNNIFVNNGWGIYDNSFDDDVYPLIEENVFYNLHFGIHIPFGTRSTIRSNVFYVNQPDAAGLTVSDPDTMRVYNNICIAVKADYGLGQSNRPAIMHNNLVYGNFRSMAMAAYGNYSDTKNNLILSETIGLYTLDNPGPGIQYNNSWGGTNNYANYPPDSTNMTVNPLIVSRDSLDFHLQMYSPMIDAGDPAILDVDGTRSDIGPYGGPYGKSYEYKDLPPLVPVITNAYIWQGKIYIKWYPSTEVDFKCFIVYRDTIKGFNPDSSNEIAETINPYYIELPGIYTKLYYKVIAVDKRGNTSKPSEEASITITGVNEQKNTVEDYRLYQNYPNPFNPSTKIGYRLTKPGRVRVVVYDLKGCIIKELVNKYCAPGYYEAVFSGEAKEIKDPVERFASGVYICRIEIKNENNIPVFTDSRKMIFIK